MKRKHLLWIVPWIAFGLGACATVPRTVTEKACSEWRWIGVLSPQESQCPDITGWDKPHRLFASPAAARSEAGYHGRGRGKDPDPELVRRLNRFCVYETGKKRGTPRTEGGKLVRVDQDCAALSVAGGRSPAGAWKPFSEQFLAQAGQPGAPLEIKNRRGVRLAFLDTHPTSDEVPKRRPTGKGTSEHGYTLAHMARNLICSEEDCAAMITTRLALPIRHFNPKSRTFTKIDERKGGSIGRQSDLAKAIRDEVDAWRADLENEGAPQHLVLNLSVGWDGGVFDGLSAEQISDLNAGTQAVYWALRYAADFDVLVLAAAGNACLERQDAEGPLLPAAWEQEVPLAKACGEQPPTAPLVYAVGGVDARGDVLANARRRAMPRRAAYGAAGVVPALARGESTHMYTGTSVATAVVSSIAAIVWDTLPDGRDRSHVMNLLDRTGETLTTANTDFWFGASTLAPGGSPPPVHRLSLCSALQAACVESPGGCPLRQPGSVCPSWPTKRLVATARPTLRGCYPWVHTQPPDEPCPICEPPRN